MTRKRTLIASLLTVLAVSAAASASASAREFVGTPCYQPGGTSVNWWSTQAKCESVTPEPRDGGKWRRTPLANGTKVEGTSGESTLTATILGVKIEIKCEKDTFSDTLESGGKSGAGSISFKECKLVTAEKKCKLTSSEKTEIPTTFNEDQLEEKVGRLIDRFEKVGATNTFATIVIEKVGSETCTIEGSYKVTGSQYCELDKSNSEAETLKPEHELICNTGGSELYIGSISNPATFTSTANVKLHSGENWAVE